MDALQRIGIHPGAANCCASRHWDMSYGAWLAALGDAYRDPSREVDAGGETPIDPYATTSPAEFFAVCGEALFELPHLLANEYSAVYRQLKRYHCQDALLRLRSCCVT